MELPPVPRSRADFHVAIICALTLEVDPVEALFQFNWERNGDRSLPKRQFTKAVGDRNAYKFGYMSGHNVVLSWTPGMGPTAAASTASSLRSSFPSIKLLILVGICGAVPEYEHNGGVTQIFLGDVIVSNGLVPYASVKTYPRESVMRTSLPRPNNEIQVALSGMTHLQTRKQVLEDIPHHIQQLLSSDEELQKRYCFPGREHDGLFHSTYIHKHHDKRASCKICESGEFSCAEARDRSCAELGCDESRRVLRRRVGDRPAVHYGLIGSGDVVMKSGQERDSIAKQHRTIAFEMEGLGIWENLPTLVVKGACDYSDSHKSKKWQNYAAATAAAYALSFLECWRAEDVAAMPIPTIPAIENCIHDEVQNKRHFTAPMRNPNYVPRPEVSEKIQHLTVAQEGDHVRIGICGLGGLGKTQIAMDFAYTKKATVDHVFWVHSATLDHLYKDYRHIGTLSNVLESAMKGANTAEDDCGIIRNWLDSAKSGEWILVLDNLDTPSPQMLNVLAKILPRYKGTLLITSINSQIEGSLVDIGSVIHLNEMSLAQAKKTFQKLSSLSEAESNSVATESLLKQLGNMPLAIAQAAAYIRTKGQKTATKCLAEIQASEERKIALLERRVVKSLDEKREMSAMTTWEVPFEYIKSSNASAASLLQVMSLLDCQSIPKHLLTTQALKLIGLENEEQVDNAIEDLLAFALVIVIDDEESPTYQIHRLVSLWTRKTARCIDHIVKAALLSVCEFLPRPNDLSFPKLSQLLPHATAVVPFAAKPEFQDQCAALNYRVSVYQCYVGDYKKSESLVFKCYEQFSARDNCLEDVFWCLYHIGLLKQRQGQYRDSQHWYYLAQKTAEKLFDSQNPILIQIEQNLGLLLVYLEDLEGAFEKFARILQQKEVDRKVALHSHNNMGSIFLRQGKCEKAVEQYQIAVQGWENLQGPEAIETLVAKGALAAAHREQHDYAAAIQIFGEVVPSLVAKFGEDHPWTLEMNSHVAVCLKNQGLYEEASQLYQRVLVGQQSKIGKTHFLTLNTLHNMGENFLKWEKYDKALDCFHQVLEGRVIEAKGGKLPSEYYATLDSMGDTFKAQKLYDQAICYYQQAWEGAQALGAEGRPFFLDILERKSGVLLIEKMYHEAFTCLQIVLKGRISAYGEGHMKVNETWDKMAEVMAFL